MNKDLICGLRCYHIESVQQVAEYHMLGRLIKNVQMQGTRNSEE